MLIYKQLVAICLVLFSVQGDNMASPQELEAFRIAIALTEGGGKIDYTQVNTITGAYGAYQFLPQFWEYHSTTADYPGADIEDPAAQDAVARYWFNRNYNDLGSWELAAIAHFGGRTIAPSYPPSFPFFSISGSNVFLSLHFFATKLRSLIPCPRITIKLIGTLQIFAISTKPVIMSIFIIK